MEAPGELFHVALCRTCDPNLPIPFGSDWLDKDPDPNTVRERWTVAHLAAFPNHDIVWREELVRQGRVRERLHKVKPIESVVWTSEDAKHYDTDDVREGWNRITIMFDAPSGGEVRVDTTTGEIWQVIEDVDPAQGRGSWGWPRAEQAIDEGMIEPERGGFDPDTTGPLFGVWAPPTEEANAE
jgi:hypothetical protein